MSNSQGTAAPLIVFVGNFEFPDHNAAATRIKAVAEIFYQAGCQTALIGICRDQAIGPYDLRPRQMDGSHAATWEVGYPRSSKEWMYRLADVSHLQKVLKTHYPGQAPIVVCYNYPALAQFRMARLARRLGGQAVGDISEWYATQHGVAVKPVIKNIDTALRMRWVSKRMDGLITSSPFLDSYYAGHVPNRMQLPTLVDRSSDVRSAPVASPDGMPKRLFFAGSGFDADAIGKTSEGLKDRLDWVLEMLDDATLAGKFHLDVYGVTKSAFCGVCPEQVTRVDRLGAQVTFHGRQPRDLVLQSLEQADYAIFLRKPTRVTRAGFPTKFSEAITHGTPVLTNPLENLEPFLHDGTNGFALTPDDRNAACKTLQKALSLSQGEILDLKAACLAQRDFQPDAYVSQARTFIEGLKGL